MEKEKRNSRSLEQYLSESNASKEQELTAAMSEHKLLQAALAKAEAHALSVENLYKAQVAKLSATVERLNGRSAAGGKGAAAGAAVDPSDSFAAVLREEMRVMQASFTLKLQRAADEAATKQSEASRQNRVLQEQLQEEKRKNTNLLDKLSRASAAAAASSPSPSPSPSPSAASGSSGAGSMQHFPPAPTSARTGSTGTSATAAHAAASSKLGSTSNGSSSSSSRAGSAATTTAAKPVVKSKPAK